MIFCEFLFLQKMADDDKFNAWMVPEDFDDWQKRTMMQQIYGKWKTCRFCALKFIHCSSKN